MNLNRIRGQITNDFDETEIHRNLHSTTNCAQKSFSFSKDVCHVEVSEKKIMLGHFV